MTQEVPLVFQGQWNLLAAEQIRQFVLAPLPREVGSLVEKFPELGETFARVGISKITDLQKLQGIPLTLPGLAQGEDIPCEVVFAKTAGRLIDFPTVLSVGEQGQVKQKIHTIAGKPLELAVKPCQPGEGVKGYIVFKSRSVPKSSLQLPANSLAASVLFGYPVFAQVQEQPVRIEEALVLLEFDYTDPDQNGIYTAEIKAPLVEGEYEVITVMSFEDPSLGSEEIRLITVVDPEGYVYEKQEDRETRIPGAIVSLYWLNPETKQYAIWPAKNYQQENPQITDVTGRYSFLVPEGSYYLFVEAPGYLPYQGKVFQVREGFGVHMNIELKTQYSWLGGMGWERIVLALVVLLLLLNFWRDKMRSKVKNQNAK